MRGAAERGKQTVLPDVVIGKMFAYDKYLTVQLYGNIDHILNNQDEFERVILGQFTACSYNGTMYHLVKTGNDNTPKSYSIMTIRHLLELDGENEYVTTSMIIILTCAAMHSDTKIKAIRQHPERSLTGAHRPRQAPSTSPIHSWEMHRS